MKLIINLCPTGMIPTKKLNPYVPITPKEIIDTAVDCADLGARIVHIHPRDKNGKPTWKKEAFAKIIGGIRDKTDQLLISATTSGRFWGDFDKRTDCLELKDDLKPDLASLTVGSNNFMHSASVNSPDTIKMIASKMMDKGIKPELEVFEPGMINMARYLIKKEIISDKNPYFNFLLGSLGTSPLNISCLAAFLALLPENSIWGLAGIGKFQLQANVMALAAGGHLRVGLEDNLYKENGKLATNQFLVSRIRKISDLMGFNIASSIEVRQILDI